MVEVGAVLANTRLAADRPVLAIFWTMLFIGPMSDEGAGPAVPSTKGSDSFVRPQTPSVNPEAKACSRLGGFLRPPQTPSDPRSRHRKGIDTMRQFTFLALASLVLLALASGCATQQGLIGRGGCNTGGCLVGSCDVAPETCQSCSTGSRCGMFSDLKLADGCRNCRVRDPGRSLHHSQAFTPGPPVGTVVYPYYTVRGPRDFLVDDPRPIGP